MSLDIDPVKSTQMEIVKIAREKKDKEAVSELLKLEDRGVTCISLLHKYSILPIKWRIYIQLNLDVHQEVNEDDEAYDVNMFKHCGNLYPSVWRYADPLIAFELIEQLDSMICEIEKGFDNLS